MPRINIALAKGIHVRNLYNVLVRGNFNSKNFHITVKKYVKDWYPFWVVKGYGISKHSLQIKKGGD